MIALLLGRILFLFAAAAGCAWLWVDGSSTLFLSPRNAVLLPWTGLFLWLLGIAEIVALRLGGRAERIGMRHLVWVAPFALFPLVDRAGLSAGWARGRAQASVATTDSFLVPSPTLVADSADVPVDTLEPLPALDPDDSADAAPVPSPGVPIGARNCKAVLPVPAAPRRSGGWCTLPVASDAPCFDTLRDGNWFERFRAIETSPQEHRGRRIVVTGFVIPADPGERWGFLLSRMLVWCCAADASPIGFRVVQAPGETIPDGDGWYEIAGTVSSVHSRTEGRTVPVLMCMGIRRVGPPAQPNVFPFSY